MSANELSILPEERLLDMPQRVLMGPLDSGPRWSFLFQATPFLPHDYSLVTLDP